MEKKDPSAQFEIVHIVCSRQDKPRLFDAERLARHMELPDFRKNFHKGEYLWAGTITSDRILGRFRVSHMRQGMDMMDAFQDKVGGENAFDDIMYGRASSPKFGLEEIEAFEKNMQNCLGLDHPDVVEAEQLRKVMVKSGSTQEEQAWEGWSD